MKRRTTPFRRGLALLCWLCALTASACARPEPADTCSDCNILLISIDTLRADHLGCYGYTPPTSPNVDRFAGESVLFETAVAHAPSTESSHASIFTSLLPTQHGAFRSRKMAISRDVVTMAELLKKAGFRTVSFNGGGQLASHYGFSRGFEIYESTPDGFSQKVDEAKRWITEHTGERFFMFLHSYEVHAPYTPSAAHLEPFDRDYAGKLPDRTGHRLLIDVNEGRRSIDEADLRHIVATYDGEIRSMDEAFGELHAFLKGSGLLDDTLVLFTSDHGEEFGEHGLVGRHSNTLHDELLRVPLIVRFPGARYAATRVTRQVRGIDILPTVVEWLELESLEQAQGASLMPLAMERADVERPAVSQVDSAHPRPAAAIRTDADKLIVGAQRFVEDAAYRWFAFRAEVESTQHGLLIPIESFYKKRKVQILIDGELERIQTIHPGRRQVIQLGFNEPARRTVAVESVARCIEPETVGVELEVDCAAFRIFNRDAYFRLDDDPGERNNLYADAASRQRMADLERTMSALLANRPEAWPGGEAIEVDPQTLEQLKALGYLE